MKEKIESEHVLLEVELKGLERKGKKKKEVEEIEERDIWIKERIEQYHGKLDMYTNGRNLKRTKGTKEFDYEAWKKIILWKGKEEMAQLTMKKGKKSKLKGKLSEMKKGKD